ncbi:MAG: ankyrin repeat domain-containing protein [Candidatus ainarchaeum sp.]|nr:ankyrin repeat domain-containing protein [Candidatus ainarchaeum sp.]
MVEDIFKGRIFVSKKSRELLKAAEEGNNSKIESLLSEKGKGRAYIEARDPYGRTPLMKAAFNGHIKTVRLLWEKYNANPDAKDWDGQTALIRAVIFGHGKVVTELLNCGTDPRIKDRTGGDAIKNAMKFGQFQMINIIKNHHATLKDQPPPKIPQRPAA